MREKQRGGRQRAVREKVGRGRQRTEGGEREGGGRQRAVREKVGRGRQRTEESERERREEEGRGQ